MTACRRWDAEFQTEATEWRMEIEPSADMVEIDIEVDGACQFIHLTLAQAREAAQHLIDLCDQIESEDW